MILHTKAPGVPSGIRLPQVTPPPATRAGTATRRVLVTQEGQNSTLAGIAQSVYGNPSKWPVIYNANLSKIKNPAVLVPGVSLVVP